MKRKYWFQILLLVFFSCKGQEKIAKNIESFEPPILTNTNVVCTSELKKINVYIFNKKLEYNIYYTWGFSDDGKYKGFNTIGEIILSWMISSQYEWMAQLYEHPEDTPDWHGKSFYYNPDPRFYKKNYFVLKHTTHFSFSREKYVVVNLEEYQNGQFFKKKILVLKSINGIYKIVTRIKDESLKDLIVFTAFIKPELLSDLKIGGTEKPTNSNPIFLEAYKLTRAETTFRYHSTKDFSLDKFLKIIKIWKKKKKKDKLSYFYDEEKDFIGLKID